jgi:hypothetical protein
LKKKTLDRLEVDENFLEQRRNCRFFVVSPSTIRRATYTSGPSNLKWKHVENGRESDVANLTETRTSDKDVREGHRTQK